MASTTSHVITLEEHWCSRHTTAFYAKHGLPDPNAESGILAYAVAKLKEFGPERLSEMDANGVSTQVVSHAPNSAALDVETCEKINAELHELILNSGEGRFAAFATLPMAYPEAAAAELRHCVKDFKFLGTLIDSNCAGRYYDDDYFWPVFQAAEELGVPVYLHPAPNQRLQDILYTGNFVEGVAESMSQYGWGWHNETAVHFLRLYAAGVFDRYPKLKLVLGHAGEMLPFQLDRIERISRLWQDSAKLQRPLRQVWDTNVWITLSGMFAMAPMVCVLEQCKTDRIMFSVDYPFGNTKHGVDFLAQLKKDRVVTDDVLDAISFRNAEDLLGIKIKSAL